MFQKGTGKETAWVYHGEGEEEEEEEVEVDFFREREEDTGRRASLSRQRPCGPAALHPDFTQSRCGTVLESGFIVSLMLHAKH